MPHVMMLGSPRPRKLRPDSNRMADEMVRVATMTSGGMALGRMTRDMMVAFPAPIVLAAAT